MKSILLITICVIAFGCRPCRELAAPSVWDSTRVEVKVRTEYVRDTVFIEVPAEHSEITSHDSSHLETSFALSDARINPDGTLFHSLANKQQPKPATITKEVVYRDSTIYRDRIETVKIPVERELSGWQRMRLTGFWILLAILLLIVRFRF